MLQDQQVENYEEPEYVDQSVWVPQGAEVVPAASFLNGHVIAVGKRFAVSNAGIADKLLEAGRIDDSHHSIALRVAHLFRMATSKQDYATMQIFSPSRGYDHSDFCPMTVFIRITRTLKHAQFHWIRVLCGLETEPFETVSRNADLVKEALEMVEANLHAYEAERKDQVPVES